MLTGEFKEGRRKSVVVPQNVDAVPELIIQDRHVTYCDIKASLGINMTSIHKKRARVDWCKKNYKKYEYGPSKAVHNIKTGDEFWIYVNDPETKQQPTVWVLQDEPNPTKVIRFESTL
ncbi:hypothetical protein EVAR_53249_1 [Eumeta japonica]|uniref:Mariner Mos1 transposase n=1 Tax=Eumeta variegata TaxID=151549 RepID=A0A4C1XFU7_EUMVA|nr:hypothetical protein EVAR_53249_1 [Eumeta japonica]